MKKDRIWTVLMIGATLIIVVLVMVLELIDRPESGQEADLYKTSVTMTKSQSKYRNEDGSDKTYYGYYELEEEAVSGPSGEPDEEEEQDSSLMANLQSYDEKVNWGVKIATNKMKSSLAIAGLDALSGDVSSAADEVTDGIGNYLGDLYDAIAP